MWNSSSIKWRSVSGSVGESLSLLSSLSWLPWRWRSTCPRAKWCRTTASWSNSSPRRAPCQAASHSPTQPASQPASQLERHSTTFLWGWRFNYKLLPKQSPYHRFHGLHSLPPRYPCHSGPWVALAHWQRPCYLSISTRESHGAVDISNRRHSVLKFTLIH